MYICIDAAARPALGADGAVLPLPLDPSQIHLLAGIHHDPLEFKTKCPVCRQFDIHAGPTNLFPNQLANQRAFYPNPKRNLQLNPKQDNLCEVLRAHSAITGRPAGCVTRLPRARAGKLGFALGLRLEFSIDQAGLPSRAAGLPGESATIIKADARAAQQLLPAGRRARRRVPCHDAE
jgi:hypothetical protein